MFNISPKNESAYTNEKQFLFSFYTLFHLLQGTSYIYYCGGSETKISEALFLVVKQLALHKTG